MDRTDVLASIGALAIGVGLLMISVPLALVGIGAFLLVAARSYSLERKKAADG